MKDPISRHAEPDDRWIGTVTWIGKADRGDQHMTVSTDGRAVELCRPKRRIPLSQRWKAEAMTRIMVTPWQPKITEPGEIKPRRRYITWAMLQQFGSSPNCRNCAGDGGAHSESCRLRFEKIWDKEEARGLRALAGELGRPSGKVGAAEEDASTATRPPPVREPETTTTTATQVTQSSVPAVPATQSPSPDAPMETSETAPGRDLDVRVAERQPKRRRELEDVEMTAVLAQPPRELMRSAVS